MRRMLYVNDDGSCTPFNNPSEMVHAIKRDAAMPKVTTKQELQIQGVIALAIREQGGRLYEDNGEAMAGHIGTIFTILGLERG